MFRFLITVLIESLFGIFTGFLLLIPIGAVSSGQMGLAEAALLFSMNLALIAPIIASLYTWTLRSWIARPRTWAVANTLGALSLGLLMFLAVFLGGLRLTTLPELILSSMVIVCEWCVGVMVARWQRRLLTAPFQLIASWQRWSTIGWTVACLFHWGIAFVALPGGISLWLGTAAAFLIYGIISHGGLAWFALNTKLAIRLQHQGGTGLSFIGPTRPSS